MDFGHPRACRLMWVRSVVNETLYAFLEGLVLLDEALVRYRECPPRSAEGTATANVEALGDAFQLTRFCDIRELQTCGDQIIGEIH